MKFRDLFIYKKSEEQNFSLSEATPSLNYPYQANTGGAELSGNFRKDFAKLKDEFAFGKSGDIKMREFTVKISEKEHNAVIFFIDGLVNKQMVNDFILRP
ncbi:MAG: spore germination protein, partial [Clostridia bacterium]|nr:spore germination protein [Clostridia bacterium]